MAERIKDTMSPSRTFNFAATVMGRKRKSVKAADETSAKVPKVCSDGEDNVRVKAESSGTNTASTDTPGGDPTVDLSSTSKDESGERVKRKRKPRHKSYNDDKLYVEKSVRYKEKFTVREKEKLLAALKRHGSDDYELLAKNVPTRTVMEIKWFIENKRKNPKVARPTGRNRKNPAPIEQWLSAASDLTRHKVDYSNMLGQVMAIAGNYELRKRRKQIMAPNYTAIYGYITELLEGTFPDVSQLKPIDAVVILDLLQGLADHLKTLDLENQGKLMLAKYKLLNTKVSLDNTSEAYQAVARALQDDLLETERAQSDLTEASPFRRPVSSAAGSSASTQGASGMESGQGPQSASNVEPSTSVNASPQSETDNFGTVQTDATGTAETRKANWKTKRRHNQNRDSTGRINRWPVIEAKKSKLYTLNPFAIGVKYLRPQKKNAADTTASQDIASASSAS